MSSRAPVEDALGWPLGDVRLHTGPEVRVAARAARVAAFTLGRDVGVAVAPGMAVPEGLLRHELVHVAQQAVRGRATAAQAEVEAEAAGRDLGALGPLTGTPAPYVAYAAEDWLQTSRDVRGLGYSELVDELRAVEEWLARQISSTPDSTRMTEVKAELEAELARRQDAMSRADRPRRRRRRGSAPAAAEELPAQTEMPRVLHERTSVQLTDPAQVRQEVDRITTWLQRPDLSRADRSVLRLELSTLAPQLGADLEQASAERRQARLARALSPSGSTDRAGVLANLRMIESISAHPDQPGMAYVLHEGEMLVFPQTVADDVRAQALSALQEAARGARALNDSTEDRMDDHMRLNYEEQPYVGFVVSVFSGEDPVDVQRRMLDPLSDSQIALGRYRNAQQRGSLVDMADAVFTAVENADRAHDVVMAGVDRAIATAGSVVTGLTITRNLSFAIALSIGAILAAPVVAAGVAGAGATGLTATGLTALGTGGVVGTGGAGLGFISGAGGELAAGHGLDRALEAGLSEGGRVGGQGIAIGLGGGAALGLARTLGVGAQGLSRGQQLLRAGAAQGGGNALGSATGGFLEPGEGQSRGESALRGGAMGLGFGIFGGAAGTFSQTLGSPAARYAVGTAAPSLLDTGVTYYQTGDWQQAALAGGMSLTTGTLGGRQARGETPGQRRAFELGVAARRQVASVGRTGRSLLGASMLGLADVSPAFRMAVGSSTPTTLDFPAVTGRAHPAPVPTGMPAETWSTVAPAPLPAARAQVGQGTSQQRPSQQRPSQQGAPQQGAPTAQAPAPLAPAARTPAQLEADRSFAGLVDPVAPSQRLRSAPVAAEEAAVHGLGDMMGGTYSSASRVRAHAGVTGAQFEAAHLLAKTIGAAVNAVRPGSYSPGRALAVLLPPRVHSAFDQGWVSLWNQRVASGQRTTLGDARSLLITALDQVPPGLMTPHEQGSLMTMIDYEITRLGMPMSTVLFGGP